MNFQQFTKRIKQQLCGTQIQEESECHGYSIIMSTEGKVFVDYKETELSSIEEAVQYINQIILEQELTQELYEDIPETKIAELIKEYHDVKVTDTLIESYVELASSNIFSVDPVVCELRKFNKLDRLIEGKINYTLNDGNVIAIDEATQEYLNKLLQNQTEIIEYMRESKNNFLNVLEQIGE